MNLMRIQLRDETDLVNCRQRARQIAHMFQLDQLQQTQFATAVSEIARNALRFAAGGKVIFSLKNDAPLTLLVTVEDQGPGIADVESVIATTQGMGLKGCYRLMDSCEIHSELGLGTTVTLGKLLQAREPFSPDDLNTRIDQLLRIRPADAMAEVRLQNTELLVSLEELKKQQDALVGYQAQLEGLNKELADTNRGVIALNIELEDQAKTVREASEVKARFLSHITHEFRTPVNSMLSMSRILLSDGVSLSEEQKKQVTFMRRAAEGLSEMVNDLLDTVKADAGKWEVVLAPVSISEVFDTLKAMFRPLMPSDRNIELIFNEESPIPIFLGDETKIGQILRNFISNALKFTESGTIQVTARILTRDGLELSVQDSGIGIAPEHQGMIFEEFMQVQGPHQKRAKGTGLGLPLARKLARLLDGEVNVKSEFGKGATFSVRLPLKTLAQALAEPADATPDLRPLEFANCPKKILVIDDDETAHYAIRDVFADFECDFAFALNGKDGLNLVSSFRPDLIILDIRMPGMDGFEVLKHLKSLDSMVNIPVLLNSSMRFSMEDFPSSVPRPTGILLKDNVGRGEGLRQIKAALQREQALGE